MKNRSSQKRNNKQNKTKKYSKNKNKYIYKKINPMTKNPENN